MKKLEYHITFILFLFLCCFLGNKVNANHFSDTSFQILEPQRPKKIGQTFYLKTEWLNTGLRYFFVKPTYDIDIQGTIRLSNHLHIVATYGATTFDLTNKVFSIERENVFQETIRTGKANHRSSLMFRYYPFSNLEEFQHYLFFEVGGHFMQYSGETDYNVYNENTATYETDYLHHIEMYRYGAQFNVGLSLFHKEKPRWDYLNDKNLIFSPEIFIGIIQNQIQILQDDYTVTTGEAPSEAYSEEQFRLTMRAKVGIGFSGKSRSRRRSKTRF